ncbi:MAG: SMC family ATPase [Candidatus Dadabacteria bacterium]|nr:SMC family ATPase [Candidatus Dadabacteria bacterium]
MVPLKLSLRNFLSYGDNTASLDFRNFKIACLSGKNGHGKSALIDAMTWALWGKCRVKIKDEVIRRGASEARVEFEFESENNIYRILRSIERKKGGTSTSIYLNIFDSISGTFKPLDEGSKTQNTIENILKMDYNTFICSSFILQGMADEFTKRTPSERKEILSKILKLDEYELITKKARQQSQNFNIELNTLENEEKHLEDEVSEKKLFEEKLKLASNEEKKLSIQITEFEIMQGKLITQNESIKAKHENLNKLIRDKEENSQKCLKLESELNQLTSLIQKDKEITSIEKEILKGFKEYEDVLKQEKVLSENELIKSKLETDLEITLNLINSEKTKILERLSSLKTKREEFEKILKTALETTSRQEEITSGFKKFTQLQSFEKELENKRQFSQEFYLKESEIKNKIEQGRIELEASARELKSKAQDLKAKSEKKDGLIKEIGVLKLDLEKQNETQSELNRINEKLNKLREDKSAQISGKAELEKRKDEEINKLSVISFETKDPHCPLCESPLQNEAREALIEKLNGVISDLGNKLIRTKNYINRSLLEERKLSDEIEKAQSETKRFIVLNKELGEKEQSLHEVEHYSKEFKTTYAQLKIITRKIEDQEYIKDFSKELDELYQKKSELGYDSDNHSKVKEELEKFRRYVTENELLKSDKIKKSQYEKEIKDVQTELRPLYEKLEQESFSQGNRKKVLKIKTVLSELSYDENKHKELRTEAKRLELYSRDKENLDKAKLGLSIREKEEKKITLELINEKKKSEAIQKELNAMERINSESKEIKQKLESATNRIDIMKKNKNEILTEITRSENHLERIEKLLNKRKEVQERIKIINRDLVIFKELVKAFGKNGLQALIIENAVPDIEIEANKILSRLTEGSMSLSLEMVRPTLKGRDKETLEIYIGDSSGTRSYETFSGGEAFRINFALRVAISKFIANRSGAQLRTLVVDEGFGTQDKDGLDQFVQVINIIKDDFDKILAITHVEELKERFPVRIEVTKEPGVGSSFEVIYS